MLENKSGNISETRKDRGKVRVRVRVSVTYRFIRILGLSNPRIVDPESSEDKRQGSPNVDW